MLCAALVVVIAGLHAAREFVVPVVFSVMLTIIAMPPVQWLKGRGAPDWIAVPLVVLLYLAILTAVLTVVGTSLADFTASLPEYEEDLQEAIDSTLGWLSGYGIDLERVIRTPDPAQVMRVASSTIGASLTAVSNLTIIGLLMFFMLFEGLKLGQKVQRAFGEGAAPIRQLDHIADQIQSYLGLKTLISLLTGALAGGLVAVFGLDYPALWGLLAFLLNFIPNVGSVIAAIPAVLLAFLQLGTREAVLIMIGYAAINTVIGNLVEPRVMGRGLGLSTLVVFLSLLFWGGVWGAPGMLLAVPMTLLVKILLESNESTRWLAVLLGPASDEPDDRPLEADP